MILAWKAALIIFAGLISLEISAAEAAEKTVFPAPGGQQTILSVHGATDLAAMEPLIRDFQGLSPTVTVEYNEYLTNDLFNRAASECDAKQGTMDLVLSSSADHLVKLVNDGCALNYRSVMTHRLPSWTRWRDEVFGFTFEPAVIVYNRDLVPPEDVRRTRAELIDLLRTKPEQYNGKIGSFDISQSGVGYLFASYDAHGTTTFGRLLEAFGRAGPRRKLLYDRSRVRPGFRAPRHWIQPDRILCRGCSKARRPLGDCDPARLHGCPQPRGFHPTVLQESGECLPVSGLPAFRAGSEEEPRGFVLLQLRGNAAGRGGRSALARLIGAPAADYDWAGTVGGSGSRQAPAVPERVAPFHSY